MNAPSDNPANDPAGRQLVEDIHNRKHLIEIQERLRKTTSRPWTLNRYDHGGGRAYVSTPSERILVFDAFNAPDREFLYNAPTDIEWLLEEHQQRDTAIPQDDACPCGHTWDEHNFDAGCIAGWEYDGPDPGIASKDGCHCRLAHTEKSR